MPGRKPPITKITDLPDHLQQCAKMFVDDGTIAFPDVTLATSITNVPRGTENLTSLFRAIYDINLLAAYYVFALYVAVADKYNTKQIGKAQADAMYAMNTDKIMALACAAINEAYRINGDPGRKLEALGVVARSKLN